MNFIDNLLSRRSVKAADLYAPAPSAQQLEHILTAAMRVPDHGKLAPWRIHLFDKEAQKEFGALCANRFSEGHPHANAKQIAHEASKLSRAPLLIAITHEPVHGKIPLWEQELSTGAVCMNLLHATHALGFAGQWLTQWIAFDETITRTLCQSSDGKIAGFFYLGSAKEAPEDRPRPDYSQVVSNWNAAPTYALAH